MILSEIVREKEREAATLADSVMRASELSEIDAHTRMRHALLPRIAHRAHSEPARIDLTRSAAANVDRVQAACRVYGERLAKSERERLNTAGMSEKLSQRATLRRRNDNVEADAISRIGRIAYSA